MRLKFDQRRMNRFLEALEQCGSVTHAAAIAGISRDKPYRRRQVDPEFAKRWDRAVELGIAALEDAAVERAMAGSDRLLMFVLNRLRPEKYRQRSQVEISGPNGSPIARSSLTVNSNGSDGAKVAEIYRQMMGVE